MTFETCLDHRQLRVNVCPICVMQERERLWAEAEQLRAENERLHKLLESLTMEYLVELQPRIKILLAALDAHVEQSERIVERCKSLGQVATEWNRLRTTA